MQRIFEGPPIDMAQQYASCMKTLYLAAFYVSIFPLGILFSILAFILAYLSDKVIKLNGLTLID